MLYLPVYVKGKMKLKDLVVSLLLLLLLGVTAGYSQEYHFKNFTVEDGLASSQVYDVVQDNKGYLWFATDCGISRYNGYEFENFGMAEGLPDQAVLHFFPQPDGKIWCTTYNTKLFYFYPGNPEFIPFRFNEILAKIPQSAILNELYIDQHQTIFLSSVNGSGFYSIDTAGHLGLHFSYDPKTGPSRLVIVKDKYSREFTFKTSRTDSLSYFFDRYETIDISSIGKTGFSRSVQVKESVACMLFDRIMLKDDRREASLLTEEPLIGIGAYESDYFWVGVLNGGAKVYDIRGKLITSFLPGRSVTDLNFDHEGGIWISTLNSGVFYLKSSNFIKRSHFPDKNNYVRSITLDPRGGVYTSYFDGTVIAYREGASSVWAHSAYGLAAAQYHPSFKRVIGLVDYNHFIGITDVPPVNNSILDIGDDEKSDGLFLFGVGFFLELKSDHTIREHKVGVRVNDIQSTLQGEACYIGSLGGLYYYEENKLSSLAPKDSLFSFRIEDIDRHEGTYYMATQGGGVVIFNDDTVYHIDRSRGLYSNMVSEVYLENDSTVWACTNAGLNRITWQKNGHYRVAGVSDIDGLINNEVTDVKVIGDSVWVGTRRGLCIFPRSFLNVKKKHIPLFLSIEKILVNEEEKPFFGLSDLSYTENRLSIFFQAISFRNKGRQLYRYRLKGLEDKWQYTENRLVNYSSLPPGDYLFELQAGGKNRDWSVNELSFPIHISPPYYATWWFRITFWGAFLVMVYLFFKIRILTYNRDIARELMRYLLKKIRNEKKYIIFSEPGKDIKISSASIQFVKSAGNYLEIYTLKERHVVRSKIGEFLSMVPDPIEYVRVHRSFIVRLDKIEQKDRRKITIGHHQIPYGRTYRSAVQNIVL